MYDYGKNELSVMNTSQDEVNNYANSYADDVSEKQSIF